MNKKPTTPFGYIAFAKNGSVTPNIRQLPDDKPGQEAGVADSLVKYPKALGLGDSASCKMLAEADHDFAIFDREQKKATVQCTEIVYRDFLASPDVKSSESILIDGKLKPVDVTKKNDVILEKIKRKIEKNYSKPEDSEFWLLIWSATGYTGFQDAWIGGNKTSPECVTRARDYLSKNGAGPFDRVVVFTFDTNPTTVWP